MKMKKLNAGFIFQFYSIYLVTTQQGFEREGALMFVQEGHNVTVTCHYQSDMAMHFSWYKHKLGQRPKLISTIYKYDENPTFYHEFKENRFQMVNGKGLTHLKIKKLQLSDSATYYCGSAHSNIVEFGEGTELIVRVPQIHSFSILQQPTLQPAHPGSSVTLECTIYTEPCVGEHSVYWFRHGSGKSSPGIIYTHRDSDSQCMRSSETGSPTQRCVYELSKRNLSLSDAGTYYCAVAACGEILYGNGTKLTVMNNKGGDCSEHLHILVSLSIVRSAALLCCAVVIIMCCCISQRAHASKSYPSSHFRKSMKAPIHAVEKNHC